MQPPGRSISDPLAAAGRESGWTVARTASYRETLEAAGDNASVAAAILPAPPPGAVTEFREFDSLLRILESRRIATLVVSSARTAAPQEGPSLLEVIPPDISTEELRGRLAMIRRYHGLVGQLEQELHNMERLSKRLNLHFRDIDQEMRLAGRLQRDFLPDVRTPVANLRFASIYRPASWVSGDVYDIFRIDEKHSGIYIADAVGHGLAAGLLTMFIKRAIVPKRIDDFGYTVLNASEVMAGLNDTLAEQALPHCQFVTACYALMNHETLEFQYARGGHPYPVLITREGLVSELKTPGGLLGLFRGEEFPVHNLTLQRGDKVIFYTDGVELMNGGNPTSGPGASPLLQLFRKFAALGVEAFMSAMENHLDAQHGSLHPDDDITLLGLEVV
jgi:sigma-B regulation protein RsbU (phosphoserine phosphatase)